MKPKILLTFIFTLGILLSLGGTNVYACCCRKEPTNLEEDFRNAVAREVAASDFVFSGRLVEKKKNHLIFEVENSWKGDLKNKVTFFYIPKNAAGDDNREYFFDSCAFIFEAGKSYLVYAKVTLNGLVESVCSRTNFVDKASRDVDELNRLRGR